MAPPLPWLPMLPTLPLWLPVPALPPPPFMRLAKKLGVPLAIPLPTKVWYELRRLGKGNEKLAKGW